jgi:hypothetical protein
MPLEVRVVQEQQTKVTREVTVLQVELNPAVAVEALAQ